MLNYYYILQLCSKLLLGHWPYSVYLYICKWPLAINFDDMPINIFSLSLLLVSFGIIELYFPLQDKTKYPHFG